MPYFPDSYTRFVDRYPSVHEAHEQLSQTCYGAGPLDATTARLVKLGIAIGGEAEGAVKSHARRALDEGIDVAAVRQAAVLALTTAGFPTTTAALSWIDEVVGD